MAAVAELGPRGGRDEGPAAGVRLALVDELTAERSAERCGQLVLTWLADHAGVERGLVSWVEPGSGRLRGLAGHGMPPAEVEALDIDPAEREHPLIEALFCRTASTIDGPRLLSVDPSDLSFHALPLAAGETAEAPAVGLLLVDSADDPVVLWAAELLGMRLAALSAPRSRGLLARHRSEVSWLSAVLESVTDPVLMTDSQGRMLVANSGAEHLLSASDDMSEGRRRAVALNNMLFSASAFTPEGEVPARREVLLVDPEDGRDLLFELLATPCRVRRNEVGTVSILRNVTDLRRATEEIEENYRRLRSAEAKTRAERDRLDLILNSVIDPVVVSDPSGNIAMMNPPAERLFTVPSGGGREAERRVRANDAVFTSFTSNLYATQEERQRGELKLRDPGSGEEVPVEAISGKVISRQGEDSAVVTILHDLTEAMEKAQLYEQVKRHSQELEARVREATTELAEQNELLRRQALELAEASRLKDQFLANVSHELRTPLNAVLGYTSLLLKGVFGEISDVQRQRLDRVESNGRHLLAIINDLLDIARIEAGKMPLDLERFDLKSLVEEVLAEVEPLVDEDAVELRRRLEADLPKVESDRQKIKQILINLLSNALKFTPEGWVEVRVERVEGDDETLRIAVADTGIGISDDHQKTIFEAFRQSGGFARKHGTGLGLSICKRLAAVLGGDIMLDSRLAEGSVFTLLLPVSSAHLQGQHEGPESERGFDGAH
ncbi:MAG TPA: ATP-binding protein [Thermoanaerobaculia bacterium]|nr:ATP-binding protein [Thermoanaerobaculia bacterium]